MARSSSAVVVRLIADAKQFSAGMKQADASLRGQALRLRRIGDNMVSLGSTLTRSVTLPLVAIGAAAAKLAIDFDLSLSRITGLVGISSDKVAGMRDRVLELAGETTKSPQELADALFFITSAGLRGSDAMEALEFSAKASAAGMGETKDVARAVTAAMQAYAGEGLGAAEATDILVGTVRAGNLEASELAGSLGKILPTASAAGVSLEQVGGAIALLTRSGLSGSESVSALNQAILALNAPTTEAKAVLEEAGISTQELQQTLTEDGLVAALELVQEAAGGNTTMFRKMLGSSEALNAAQTLLSASNEDLEATFGAVEDSAGITDNAFAAFAESAGFTAKQAFAELQVALIKFGDAIIPVVSQFARFGASVASVFGSLPGPVKTFAVALAGIAAAAGPALVVGGSLIRNWAALSLAADQGSGAAQRFQAVMRRVPKALGWAALAVGVATAVKKIGDAWLSTADDVTYATQEMATATDVELDEFVTKLADAGDELDETGLAARAFRKVLAEDPAGAERFLDAMDRAGGNTRVLREELDEAIRSQAQAQVQSEQTAGAVDQEAAAISGLAGETAEATEGLEELSSLLDEVFGDTLDVESATITYKDKLAELTAQLIFTGGTLDMNTQQGRANRQAIVDQTQAAFDLADAVFQETDNIDAANVVLGGHISQLVGVMTQTGMTEQQAFTYIGTILGIPPSVFTGITNTADFARIVTEHLLEKYDEAEGNRHTTLTADTSAAQAAVDRLLTSLEGIENIASRRFLVSISGEPRQHGGPVEAGRPYLVGEAGPELFISSERGRIIPSHLLGSFSAQTSASVVQNIRIDGPARPAMFRELEGSGLRGVRAGVRAAG